MHIVLNLIGEYNIYNCLCSLGVCYCLGLDKEKVALFVQSFSGVERRMEKIGHHKKSAIYLDYAHHPTEIYNSLLAIKQNIASKKILVVFQPHTYSRTKLLFAEFVKVFLCFDYDVIFLPTYSARENSSMGFQTDVLYDAVRQEKSNCYYLSKQECFKYIKDNCIYYSYIFFIGAGDLDKLAKRLVTSVKGK